MPARLGTSCDGMGMCRTSVDGIGCASAARDAVSWKPRFNEILLAFDEEIDQELS